MEDTAKKLTPLQTQESPRGKNLLEKIKNTCTDELILGICTHIGSQRDIVVDILKEILEQDYKYSVCVIKLSDYINEYDNRERTSIEGKTSTYMELKHKIDGGDYLRQKYKSNSLLVELAIKKIRLDRGIENNDDNKDITNDTKYKSRRKCYIIDSLKNKEELEVLRSIYQDIFYLFSIYTPSKERIEFLVNKKDGISKDEAEEIIQTDEYENIGEHGQNVRDTFIDADFFIRSSQYNKKNLKTNIERYLHLIFNSKIIIPTPQETAMYSAKSAAGNSACLSRQVGATITDSNGVPLAHGWNDVPRFGGNLYRDTDTDSQNCYIRGKCTNVTHKNEIIEEILTEIKKKLPDKQENKLRISITDRIQSPDLISTIEKIIKQSKFKSIIEYSRSIHAEMHAIIIGSQMTGNKMINGNLYCTTYPCHNCARHIVLAGIKNIYYIEPYKKSLCLTLHDDSLTEDESVEDKVRILVYEGVAPRRFLEFFSMIEDNRKKENGHVKNIDRSTAVPKKRLSLQSLPMLENQAIHALNEYGLLTETIDL